MSPSARAIPADSDLSKRDAAALRARHGLTLIELSVSLTIVGVLFAAVVMGVGALTGTRAKAMTGELAGTIRSLYDTASLSGKTCRLVFQLPQTPKGSGFEYWAECGSGNVTARPDRDQLLRDQNQKSEQDARRGTPKSNPNARVTYRESLDQEKARVESDLKFSTFTSEAVRPRKAAGVNVSVWTRHQREPTQTGVAYLYFFPQGYTERAQIYVSQGGNVWTITVSPLTGKTAVVGERLEVPRS